MISNDGNVDSVTDTWLDRNGAWLNELLAASPTHRAVGQLFLSALHQPQDGQSDSGIPFPEAMFDFDWWLENGYLESRFKNYLTSAKLAEMRAIAVAGWDLKLELIELEGLAGTVMGGVADSVRVGWQASGNGWNIGNGLHAFDDSGSEISLTALTVSWGDGEFAMLPSLNRLTGDDFWPQNVTGGISSYWHAEKCLHWNRGWIHGPWPVDPDDADRPGAKFPAQVRSTPGAEEFWLKAWALYSSNLAQALVAYGQLGFIAALPQLADSMTQWSNRIVTILRDHPVAIARYYKENPEVWTEERDVLPGDSKENLERLMRS